MATSTTTRRRLPTVETALRKIVRAGISEDALRVALNYALAGEHARLRAELFEGTVRKRVEAAERLGRIIRRGLTATDTALRAGASEKTGRAIDEAIEAVLAAARNISFVAANRIMDDAVDALKMRGTSIRRTRPLSSTIFVVASG